MFGYSHQAEGPWIGMDPMTYYPTHHQALEGGRVMFYHRDETPSEKQPVWIAELEMVGPEQLIVENITTFFADVKERAAIEFGDGSDNFVGWLDEYNLASMTEFTKLVDYNMTKLFKYLLEKFPTPPLVRVKQSGGVLHQIRVPHDRELTTWNF